MTGATPPPPLLEVAVDDIEGAVAAAAAGADRLELCAALSEGGLTPSSGLLAAVKARVTVPVVAMIRPRGGDFVYSAAERDAMQRDVEACLDNGADGLALGALTDAGAVDKGAMRPLLAAAGGVPVVCHRAFDDARDQTRALEDLIALGCARVLTSGGGSTAAAGVDGLRRLQTQARGRIVIVAAGGVRAAVAAAVCAAGVRELHAGPRATQPRRPGVIYTGRATTDVDAVRALVRALHSVR